MAGIERTEDRPASRNVGALRGLMPFLNRLGAILRPSSASTSTEFADTWSQLRKKMKMTLCLNWLSNIARHSKKVSVKMLS